MADSEAENSPDAARLSRRKMIKRAMLVGGVAVWATPIAAGARHGFSLNTASSTPSASDIREQALQRVNDALQKAGVQTNTSTAGNGVTIAQQTSPCTGYPPGSCLSFTCGNAPTQCGTGAGGFICFCDVDAAGACVCVNDAFCSQLPGCTSNGDCPPGWSCIPTSCCGTAKCAPPCGTSAGGLIGFGVASNAAASGGKISGR